MAKSAIVGIVASIIRCVIVTEVLGIKTTRDVVTEASVLRNLYTVLWGWAHAFLYAFTSPTLLLGGEKTLRRLTRVRSVPEIDDDL